MTSIAAGGDRADPPPPNLAGTGWLVAPGLARVVAALGAEGGEARVVGGAVRDALIGRPVGEVDIATTAVPDDVLRLAAAAGLKAVATGIEHGTITVVESGRAYEVTTLRRDVSTDGRRAVVAFTADWREDAMRRDFTVNALYASLDGMVHDPVEGYPDLHVRRVRFIGDARTRIREDYLRILRLFRFHAEIGEGELDGEGVAAAAALKEGLTGLSRERVRQELVRLVAAPGAAAVVEVMAGTGILAALGFEGANAERFARLIAIEARTGQDTSTIRRLAALVLVPDEGYAPAAIAERLRLANDERGRLEAMTGWEPVSPAIGEAGRRELVYRAGGGPALDRILLAWAASGAATDDPDWRELARHAAEWRPPAFPLRGRDLLGIGIVRGPALGTMLERLERHWIDEGFAPGRDELLEAAGRLQSESGEGG